MFDSELRQRTGDRDALDSNSGGSSGDLDRNRLSVDVPLSLDLLRHRRDEAGSAGERSLTTGGLLKARFPADGNSDVLFTLMSSGSSRELHLKTRLTDMKHFPAQFNVLGAT